MAVSMVGEGNVSAVQSLDRYKLWKKKSPRLSGGIALHFAGHQLSTGFQSPLPRQRASPLLWEDSHKAIRFQL
jgi:hypothetical protein